MISIILDNHNEISINVAEETDEEEEEKDKDDRKDLSTILEAESGENGEESNYLCNSFYVITNKPSSRIPNLMYCR